MRLPSIRVHTLMIVVAMVALAIGGAQMISRARRYRALGAKYAGLVEEFNSDRPHFVRFKDDEVVSRIDRLATWAEQLSRKYVHAASNPWLPIPPDPSPPEHIRQNHEPEIERAKAEVALADAALRRAVDRLDWSGKMHGKGFVTTAQYTADALALRNAKLTFEQAKAEVLEK